MARGLYGGLALALLLGASGGGVAAQDRSAAATSPADAVRQALRSGSYAEAERVATEWLREVERTRGAESLDAARATDLLVEAEVKAGKSNRPDVLARAEQVILTKQRLLAPDHPEVATSLNNLGTLRIGRGDFKAAITAYQRALSIRRLVSSPPDALVESLQDLAIPLIYLERFAEARQAIVEARRVLAAMPAVGAADERHMLYLEALLHRWDGHYADANAALERLFSTVSPADLDHPDLVLTLQLRGDLRYLAGEIEGAQMAWTQALELAQRVLGVENPAVPRLLRVLSLAEQNSGDLDAARKLLERALPVAQSVLASCHPEIPNLQSDLANLVAYSGDFLEARNIYRQAQAKSEECLGPTQSLTATIIHNRANLAFAMGDLEEAEQLHQRAVRAWRTGLGPNHPYVARGLDALAETVAARGRLTRASELLEQALAIRQRALGADHPDVAVTLVKLAQVAERTGNLSRALMRVNEALQIYQKGGLPQDPDYLASSLELRGNIQSRRGDHAVARQDYAEALATRERVFGTAHPLTATARADVASADFALQANDMAIAGALDAERVGRDHLRFTIRSLPERQALAYADKRPRGLDLALSLAAAGRVLEPAEVLDAVIQSRSVILDELAARAQLTSSESDPVLKELNATVQAARERFANLMLRSLNGDDPVPPALLSETRGRKEEAERVLAERSAVARSELSRATVNLDAVRRALPADTALVSFVRYDRTTFVTTHGRTLQRRTPSYIAFVLAPRSSTIATVPLGAASTVDALVKAWHDEVDGHSMAGGVAAADAERMYRLVGARLRLRIWDPVASYLGTASQVLIVPDGAINLVSFAALPTGSSRYLAESAHVMHFLSAERDVVRDRSADLVARGRGLLAVGGPAYDLAPAAVGASGGTRGLDCVTGSQLRFEDLPGTRAEVQDVSRIWSSSSGVTGSLGSDEVMLFLGRAATKTAIARAVSGRRVVHFATHGFFLGTGCGSGLANTRSVGGLVPTNRRTTVADSPLVLAGLAFVGANRRSRQSAQDDGILTAEEVVGLDLRGAEWAVLSACDTGLGEIRAGEGVFGLRRAFQIAGARTVIMSLWSVEDRSTRDWMRALYEGRFRENLTTAASVHGANLRLLRSRRAAGQSTHPFYWAAFVAAGDWS